MEGLLLVDKPAGWTSHDVVAKVRGVLKNEAGQRVKVGHTGTLDPFATGLLILVIGSYTKRASEFSKLDKAYEAELTLGAISSTGDIEGEINPKSAEKPPEKAIREVLSHFHGQMEQTPHAYSAVKVGGQRAYKLAREGKTPVLEPRKVTIYSISGVRYDYPKLSFTTRVSSGTYIRSLAEDIGSKLGTDAYLSVLRRSEVGDYSLKDSTSIDQINSGNLAQHLVKL